MDIVMTSYHFFGANMTYRFNSKMAEANLLSWAGGWGLPSLDSSCLQAQVC